MQSNTELFDQINILCFNRPDYASKVFNSINAQIRNIGEKININIWIDGYKNSKEEFKGNKDKTSEVYKIAKDSFDNANIFQIKENIGIARMYAKAESYCLDNSNKKYTLFFEDDYILGEGYINAYSNCYGLKSIVFRFGNVYGPNGSHKKGVVNKFIRNSINDIEHIIYGSPDSSRDYIHVYDICEAILLGIDYFSKMQKNFELFHLANFEEVTLSKLIETIEKVSKKKNSYKLLDYRKGEVLRNFCSFEKANNLLKFNPKYNLDRGIEDLYCWILENEFV